MGGGDIAWGSVGDWIAGIGTIAAVAVALVFSLRSERQQRDAHLAAVHAWFEIVPGPKGSLRLINNTDYPVYEWSVVVTWRVGDAPFVVRTSQADHGLLPPGHHDFALSAEGLPLPANDADVEVDFRFRDAAGNARRRLPSGRLVSGGR